MEFQYQINDGWVKLLYEERGLGVLMSTDLKFSKQCLLAKKKKKITIDKKKPLMRGD